MTAEGTQPVPTGDGRTGKARAGTGSSIGSSGGGRPGRSQSDPPYEVGRFDSDGVSLYYEIHGHGPRVMVFMHAILMDSAMNRRLATDLAARGFKVVLLDLPGHGLSDKPKRASYHRMDTYARHVVALLDHLGIDRAVIGGVSLGGNVSLMVAALAPGRVKGLVIEMPVLEWAVPAAALTFVPLLVAIHFARPAVSRTAWLFQRLPRTGIGALDSVMVGERADMTIPALVIGHEVDRVHPFHDAEQLARRLPDGRLIKANSVLELRVNPGRLTDRIAEFLDEVWDGQDIGRRAV